MAFKDFGGIAVTAGLCYCCEKVLERRQRNSLLFAVRPAENHRIETREAEMTEVGERPDPHGTALAPICISYRFGG